MLKVLDIKNYDIFRDDLVSTVLKRVLGDSVNNQMIKNNGKALPTVLSIRNGNLSNAVLSAPVSVMSEGSQSKASTDIPSKYANIHEYGGTIEFKTIGRRYAALRKIIAWYKANGLTEETNRGFLTTGEIKIPKRPFIAPAMDDAESELKPIADKILNALNFNDREVITI